MQLLVAACVFVSPLCNICVTCVAGRVIYVYLWYVCVLFVHVPNGNTFSALLLVRSGDTKQRTASPLSLSDLVWYFPQVLTRYQSHLNLEGRVYLQGPISNTEWKKRGQ